MVKSLFNQNAGKKVRHRYFHESTLKSTLEEIQKNIHDGALFYKNCTTDTFLVVITKEKMFKKNPLYSYPFSANVNGLQYTKSDFNKNRLREKYFLRTFCNTSETSLEKV